MPHCTKPCQAEPNCGTQYRTMPSRAKLYQTVPQWTKLQWNLNNPVTYRPVLLGCINEVAGIQLTCIERSCPFWHKWLHYRVYLHNVYIMYAISGEEREDPWQGSTPVHSWPLQAVSLVGAEMKPSSSCDNVSGCLGGKSTNWNSFNLVVSRIVPS